MSIKFYRTKEQYGSFSNFSRHGFQLDGKFWPTSEHYFQAQKFHEFIEYEERVRLAPTPKEAANIGRDRSLPLRKDWEQVKDSIMRKGVLQKFKTHEDIRKILLSTGLEEIIEDSPIDYYWGIGATGTGRNMLGRILMEVRAELKAEELTNTICRD